MNAKDIAEKREAGLECSGDRTGEPPLLGRKSVLMGILTSGFVIANTAQPSAVAAGTVKPVAATSPNYAPKWTPSTAYVRAQQVIGPTNDVVSANVAHTSSAAYPTDAAKWTLSSTFASKATETTVAMGRLSDNSLAATYVQRKNLPVNVRDYGAKGDGVTDDTAAVNAAVAAWMAVLNGGSDGALLFPPGIYNVSSTITATASAHILGGRILGQGATLKLTGGAATFALVLTTCGTGKGWQRPVIQGLHVHGGGIRLRAGVNAEFMWNAVIDQVLVTRSKTSALRLSSVFETQVINSCFEMDPSVAYTADTESCIYIEKEVGKAQPSSIDLTNVTTRGGYIGIRSPNAADVKIIGGTVLFAQHEGIFTAGMGLVVDNVHLENNWLSGVVTDAAAVRMEGSGKVGTILSIANNAASCAPYVGSTSQTFAVRTYVFGTDVSGAVTAGAIEVSRPNIMSNVVGQRMIRGVGGFDGSTLYLTGVANADATLTTIKGGRVVRHGGDATTTSGRPSAVTAGVGTSHYDTTLGKPIWSNGSIWRDSTGRAV